MHKNSLVLSFRVGVVIQVAFVPEQIRTLFLFSSARTTTPTMDDPANASLFDDAKVTEEVGEFPEKGGSSDFEVTRSKRRSRTFSQRLRDKGTLPGISTVVAALGVLLISSVTIRLIACFRASALPGTSSRGGIPRVTFRRLSDEQGDADASSEGGHDGDPGSAPPSPGPVSSRRAVRPSVGEECEHLESLLTEFNSRLNPSPPSRAPAVVPEEDSEEEVEVPQVPTLPRPAPTRRTDSSDLPWVPPPRIPSLVLAIVASIVVGGSAFAVLFGYLVDDYEDVLCIGGAIIASLGLSILVFSGFLFGFRVSAKLEARQQRQRDTF